MKAIAQDLGLLVRASIAAWGAGLIACIVVGSLAEEAKDGGPTKFLRFVDLERGEGRLETAVVTYARRDGAEVDLVAAVHVGDAAYYAALEKRFGSYDPLLYEMIKPEDEEPTPGAKPDNILTAIQLGMKNSLGLEFQLDAIDYRKKNFVHADLDPDAFFRLQREKGENILTLMLKAMKKDFELQASGKGSRAVNPLQILVALASEDSARMLKMLLARQMEDMELVIAGFEDGEKGSVIVAERNKVAVRALGKALRAGKRRIGIFYGAAHMPDMERRLVDELGFEKRRAEWVTAWDIRKKVGGPKKTPSQRAPADREF